MAVIPQLAFVYMCFVVSVSVRSQEIDYRFFLSQILSEYGNNGTISYKGFEILYHNLGLGPNLGLDTAKNTDLLAHDRQLVGNLLTIKTVKEMSTVKDLHDELASLPLSTPLSMPPSCLSAAQLLALYGVSGPNSSLSPATFLHLCPALVYELDKRTCSQPDQHLQTGPISFDNYMYAFVMVAFISLTGLLCVALVPLLQKAFISQLVSFLVALAVGTLLGDAFLHLIPHVLESKGGNHHHSDSFIYSALMFLATAGFFTFEAVVKLVKLKKEEKSDKGHSHYVPVSCPNGDREMMEMMEEPIEGHGHCHSSSNTALMILFGDGLHNLIDGLAIGGAFAGSKAAGFATSVAVLTHELPHELGDFAVLLQSGMSVKKALLCNLLLSLLSLLGTVVGLAIGNIGTSWIYAITAGTFIYIALTDLVPEINRELHNWKGVISQLTGFLLGGAIMGVIALFEHNLQNLFEQS